MQYVSARLKWNNIYIFAVVYSLNGVAYITMKMKSIFMVPFKTLFHLLLQFKNKILLLSLNKQNNFKVNTVLTHL